MTENNQSSFDELYKKHVLGEADKKPENFESQVQSQNPVYQEPVVLETPNTVNENVSNSESLQPQQTVTPTQTNYSTNYSDANTNDWKSEKDAIKKNSKLGLSSQKSLNKQNPIFMIAISVAITLVLVIALSNFGIFNLMIPSSSNNGLTQVSKLDEARSKAALTLPSEGVPDWQKVFAKVIPSVVSIQVTLQKGTALGTGFIVDKSGLIVTNFHVIDGGENGQIIVTLYGNRLLEAKVKGTDPTTDLAVLELVDAPEDLQPIDWADSNSALVGENVLVVGNPLGYYDTATSGIISALDRPVAASSASAQGNLVVTNAIQVDAAINFGNSGGTMFDSSGKMLGIPSSIATVGGSTEETSSGSIGLGFAIPSNTAKSIVNQIITTGSAKHAALGVTLSDGTVKVDNITRRAPKIESVSQGAPAELAGLKAGDFVLAVNDKTTPATLSLMGFIRAEELGATVKVSYVRDGKTFETSVKLDKEQETVFSNLNNDKKNNEPEEDENGLFDPFDLFDGK